MSVKIFSNEQAVIELKLFFVLFCLLHLFFGNPLDWVDFDFDFNMNLTLAYTSNGLGYLYWYDPVQNRYVTLQLGMCKTPTVCLTEHTPELSGYADVYLLYIRDSVYYARYLNERYAIEHVISTDYPNTKINTFGVSVNNRLQVRTVFDKGE